MTTQHTTKAFAALLLASVASSVSADVVETKSGARIVGKVTSINDSTVTVSTDFAGDLKIKQSEVVSIQTEKPLNVRLEAGTVLQGTIQSTGSGAITVTGTDGSINTTVEKVAATWAPGATDPQVAALQRSWAYEASLDLLGKTGNKEQLGTALSFRATLATSQDKLEFYTGYNRQVSDGNKSADQLKVGVDYSNNFSGKYSWYTRDEGGFDRVKDIELYNVAAAGFGYDLIKKSNQTLTSRAGLAFRYEGYKSPAAEDVKSAGLDFGLNHKYTFATGSLVTRLSYVPTFEDFSNFVLKHESYVELPLSASQWSVRVGIVNDYTSKPTPGVDRLDTLYVTRMVLNWK